MVNRYCVSFLGGQTYFCIGDALGRSRNTYCYSDNLLPNVFLTSEGSARVVPVWAGATRLYFAVQRLMSFTSSLVASSPTVNGFSMKAVAPASAAARIISWSRW